MRTEHMEKNILEQASLVTHTLSVIKGGYSSPPTHHVSFQHQTYFNLHLGSFSIFSYYMKFNEQ